MGGGVAGSAEVVQCPLRYQFPRFFAVKLPILMILIRDDRNGPRLSIDTKKVSK